MVEGFVPQVGSPLWLLKRNDVCSDNLRSGCLQTSEHEQPQAASKTQTPKPSGTSSGA